MRADTVVAVDFGVLGPLEVVADDGGILPLGPPRQRAVLALLLTEPNRALTVPRIVEALWGGRAPRTAVKNVQVYVYQLRKVLGERLRSHRSGYLLTVLPGELDADRVAALLTAARGHRAACRPAEAAAACRAALAVPRGPALADLVAVGLLASVAARMDEPLLAARVECADAELAAGRHAEVLAELVTWVAEHPSHERLREQHMLALHRSGRSVEALAAYGDAHRQLAAHAGVRPGAGLRRLHAEILAATGPATGPATGAAAGSSAVDRAGVVVGRAGAAVAEAGVVAGPRELPADLAGFAGRRDELGVVLRRATEAIAAGRVGVEVLIGQAGVGKSALATRAAHELASRCPDGQLYADLGGTEPSRVQARFLRALGAADDVLPTDPEELTARYRSATARLRVLVLLDNANSAGLVRPLLPTGPGSVVLVTGRRPLPDLDGASHLRLGRLATTDAVELLAVMAGDERIAADPGAAAELVHRCDGLPLALRIVAARLAARPEWPVAGLAARLADERHRLDELRLGDAAVRTAFAVSYRGLGGGAAARAFRLFGLADLPDLTVDAVLALLGPATDGRGAGDGAAGGGVAGDSVAGDGVAGDGVAGDGVAGAALMAELADAHLVDEPAPGRYRMHDLLRLFARERCAAEDPADARAAALDRLHRHLVGTARQARNLVQRGVVPEPGGPFTGTDGALAWLEAERGALLAVAARAEPETVVELGAALSWYFRRRSDVADWTALNEAVLTAARAADDVEGEATAHQELGSAHECGYRLAEAIEHWRAALRLATALGNRSMEAALLNNLGIVHWRRREMAAARQCLDTALELRVGLDDRPGAAYVLANLGLVHAAAGDQRAALRSYRRALALFRAAGNTIGEVRSLANIGEAQRELGMLAAAGRSTSAALTIARGLQDRQLEALLLLDLGLVRQLRGRARDAAELYLAGLRQCRDLGHRHGEAQALRRLGALAAERGDRETAVEHWIAALGVFTELGAPEAADVRSLLDDDAAETSA